MKKPNFLIVGAAKCGTTSLYHYLNQHPEIYLQPKKESFFMIPGIYENISKKDPRRKIAKQLIIESEEEYFKLFSDANSEIAIGEISPTYFYYNKIAIPNIKKHLGEPKILIILRDPSDRAYSSYSHLVRDGVEKLSFEKFLEEESFRRKDNWDILNFPIDPGMYYEQVKVYMENFKEVKILLMDDLIKYPNKLLKEIYQFLSVDEEFVADLSTKHNQSKTISKSQKLNYFLTKNNLPKRIVKKTIGLFFSHESLSAAGNFLRQKNSDKIEKIKPETKIFLKNHFREDLKKLQDLIKIDLSAWLN